MANKFNESWKFPNEYRQQFGTYTKFNVVPTNECFNSGRPKYLCTFSSTNGEIYSQNYTMQLISKVGKPYYVVSINTKENDDEHEIRRSLTSIGKDVGGGGIFMGGASTYNKNNKYSWSKELEEKVADTLRRSAAAAEEDEDDDEDDENYGSKPEPLDFKTRDFKRGHVEHTL